MKDDFDIMALIIMAGLISFVLIVTALLIIIGMGV